MVSDVDDVVTCAEAARRLGINRATLAAYANPTRNSRSTVPFPAPVLSGPRRWRWIDIAAWHRTRPRAHRPTDHHVRPGSGWLLGVAEGTPVRLDPTRGIRTGTPAVTIITGGDDDRRAQMSRSLLLQAHLSRSMAFTATATPDQWVPYGATPVTAAQIGALPDSHPRSLIERHVTYLTARTGASTITTGALRAALTRYGRIAGVRQHLPDDIRDRLNPTDPVIQPSEPCPRWQPGLHLGVHSPDDQALIDWMVATVTIWAARQHHPTLLVVNQPDVGLLIEALDVEPTGLYLNPVIAAANPPEDLAVDTTVTLHEGGGATIKVGDANPVPFTPIALT